MKAYEFNAEKVRDRLVELIRETAERQGFSRVVIGISGGKDSTVTAALLATVNVRYPLPTGTPSAAETPSGTCADV